MIAQRGHWHAEPGRRANALTLSCCARRVRNSSSWSLGGEADGAEGQRELSGLDDRGEAPVLVDTEAAQRRRPGQWLEQQPGVEHVEVAAVAAEAFLEWEGVAGR